MLLVDRAGHEYSFGGLEFDLKFWDSNISCFFSAPPQICSHSRLYVYTKIWQNTDAT